MNTDYDYLLKVIIVGDGAVGKTALSVRYTQGKFMDDYKMTIGVDFSVKMLEVDGYKVKLQLWDTGGQERFSYLRPLYYSGAVGGLIVFDKTYRPSYDSVPKWFSEVRNNRGPNIPLVLVGNKVDLPDWQVSTDEVTDLAKQYKSIYRDVSAKSGKSVEDAFLALIKLVISPDDADAMFQQEELDVTAQQQKLVMNESYNKYNKFANEASAFLEAGNYVESLNSLKKALYWARDAKYDEAIKWAEDNMKYIQQFINQAAPQTLQKVTEIMFACQTCSVYFKVSTDGDYACPECGNKLVKMN